MSSIVSRTYNHPEFCDHPERTCSNVLTILGSTSSLGVQIIIGILVAEDDILIEKVIPWIIPSFTQKQDAMILSLFKAHWGL
jgi:hypothetical protein